MWQSLKVVRCEQQSVRKEEIRVRGYNRVGLKEKELDGEQKGAPDEGGEGGGRESKVKEEARVGWGRERDAYYDVV